LLQALHVLFGVTAIIGLLVTHSRRAITEGTVYHSQLRWQFITFWLAAAGYSIGFYLWVSHQYIWVLPAVLIFLVYRLVVGTLYWRSERTLTRWL